MIINDCLIESTMNICAMIAGVLTGVVSGLLVFAFSPTNLSVSPGGIGLIGYFVGVFMASAVLSVVKSCVITMFVCLAESPVRCCFASFFPPA